MISTSTGQTTTHNRPGSSLKIQTASRLLSAAVVLTVSILSLPAEATASPTATPSLSATPIGSPATSPVMAYFGEDIQVQGAEGEDWTYRSDGSPMTGSDGTQSFSPRSTASSFLLQVDAPVDDRPPSLGSAFTKRKVKRTNRFQQSANEMHARAAASTRTSGAATASSGAVDGDFTVYQHIASTFSPSSETFPWTSTASAATSTPSASSSTQTNVPAAPASALPLSVAFPQPFDQSLSYSLSDSCVAFLATYLGSEEMRGTATTLVGGVPSRVGACGRPFSLLISSSSGWAQITRNETLLNAAVSQICYAPDADGCSDYYDSLAVDIVKNANCGADIKAKKAVALEALYGFQNYDMLQRAACLTDSKTQAYCYVSAMSPFSSPDEGYLYSLPSGIFLPSTTKPTCSTCSAKLINLFTETIINATSTTSTKAQGSNYPYASVLESALSNATAIVKQTCGSTFAGQSTTLQAHVSSGTISVMPSWPAWNVSLASAVLMVLYSSWGV